MQDHTMQDNDDGNYARWLYIGNQMLVPTNATFRAVWMHKLLIFFQQNSQQNNARSANRRPLCYVAF